MATNSSGSTTTTTARQPIRAVGIAAARRVRDEIGYEHPAELEIEVLAYMRGATVRSSRAHGARANLLRVGDRGIIGVADRLTAEERRWAIAHELGHFEAHADVSFIGLCSSDDMVPTYRASGREPEANAFAEELLMPADLFARGCDVVAKVSWEPVVALAKTFEVSRAAAAIRFASITEEAVAVVCMRDGVIVWASTSKTFGPRPRRGSKLKPSSAAHAFFANGQLPAGPQTVSASAWVDTGDHDDHHRDHSEEDVHLVEDLYAVSNLNIAMSLLWWRGE